MRRIALLAICLSVLVALVGCGQSQTLSEIKQEKIDTTKQAEKTDIKENESTPTPIPTETKSQDEDNSNNEQSIYGSFSYEEVTNSIDLGAPGVKTEGFINAEEVEMGLPIDRAKLEVTVDYDLVQTYYDSVEDIWMVHFSKSNVAGGDETVYLNGKGKTLLIVFGE